MKTFYIITAARKDDATIWRRYPVEAPDIAAAAKAALDELDGLWEIIRIAVLR
jgi:hypothetical protein